MCWIFSEVANQASDCYGGRLVGGSMSPFSSLPALLVLEGCDVSSSLASRETQVFNPVVVPVAGQSSIHGGCGERPVRS